jgi:hypothetical protein
MIYVPFKQMSYASTYVREGHLGSLQEQPSGAHLASEEFGENLIAEHYGKHRAQNRDQHQHNLHLVKGFPN